MRRWLPFLECVVIAIICAACGGAEAIHHGGKTNAVLTAYDHTVASKSAKVTLHETVSSSAGGSSQQTTITGSGVTELTSTGGDGAFTLSLPAGGAIDLRMITPELYLKLPSSLRSQVPGNRPWVSLNLDTLAKAKFGATLSQLSNSSQTPTQSLSYLQGVSQHGLTKVGTPTIDGINSTEYRATVDLNKVAATKISAAQTAIKKLETELGSSTFPVEVWVDSQQRIRQITYTLAVPSSLGTTGNSGVKATKTSVGITIGLSDFGVPVNVSAPPADQTYDATNAALSAGSSSAAGTSG